MASEKLRTIRRYLFRQGRSLDVARWAFHFEDGSARDVLRALACYQNLDGGFAHGLEPDIRTAESNPMSTWTATRILREIGLPDLSKQMVDKILTYLEETLSDNDKWPATTKAHDKGLHAPWFKHDDEEAYWGWNPTVELAAFILLTGTHRPELHAKSEGILLQALPEIMDPEYVPASNELSNITEAVGMILDVRPELLPVGFITHLEGLVSRLVTHDKAAYETTDYILTPDFVLNSPDSYLYPTIRETADFYAEHLEASVTEHGYWPIRWNWGENEFPPDALRDWRGSLILEDMLYLQHFKPEEDKDGRFIERP